MEKLLRQAIDRTSILDYSFKKNMSAKEFKPYVAANTQMAEFTVKSILLGALFGVIFGAGVAGHSVALKNAYKVLPLGLWLGISLPALAFTTSLWIAIPLMLITGFAGGMLMVPMNALLQNRGYNLLTAGRSIAVQGFNENASVMIMLGVYSGLLAMEFPLHWVMIFMGSTMILGMLYLMRTASHKTPSTCSAI